MAERTCRGTKRNHWTPTGRFTETSTLTLGSANPTKSQIQSFHASCPVDMQPNQEGAVLALHEVCGPSPQESIYFSSLGQGRPGSIQHPLWVRSGRYWADTRFEELQPHFRLEHPDKSAESRHSINLGRHIQLHHTVIPSTKHRYMDRIVREAFGIELRHSNKIRVGGFSLSKSRKPLICSLIDRRSPRHMTVNLGSPWDHAGPCTLPLLGPQRALTTLQPDVPAPLPYVCSLLSPTYVPSSSLRMFPPLPYVCSLLSPTYVPSSLLRMFPHPPTHASDSLDFSPCPQHLHTLSLFFPRPARPPILRAILNSCSCLLLVRSVVVWHPSIIFLSHGEPIGTDFYLPFPSRFLCPTIRLLGLPPAFTLVHRCAYSTLKMEAICYPETVVNFQQTTWRLYIPKDSTHNQGCENLKSDNQVINHNLYLRSPSSLFASGFQITILDLHFISSRVLSAPVSSLI
jgi:hypothetical protein